jgi:hypothetical protein
MMRRICKHLYLPKINSERFLASSGMRATLSLNKRKEKLTDRCSSSELDRQIAVNLLKFCKNVIVTFKDICLEKFRRKKEKKVGIEERNTKFNEQSHEIFYCLL